MNILEADKLDKQTQEEVQRMLDSGMIEIDKKELEKRLDALGYYISKLVSFNYVNCSNQTPYKAKHAAIYHKVSMRGFANKLSPNTTLDRLQELRCNHFVCSNGVIWEL